MDSEKTSDNTSNDLKKTTENDTSMTIRCGTFNNNFEAILHFIWAIIMCHNLLWFWPCLGFLLGLRFIGYTKAFWTILVLYSIDFMIPYHLKGGRPWNWLLRNKIWSLNHKYLNLTFHREQALDSQKQYIFGWHPHGILIVSRIAVYGDLWEKLFPGIETRTLAATPLFYFPGAREISLAMGAVDAGRESANLVMRKGYSIIVYPGGSREIFKTNPNSNETELVLKRRKGFVKLALKHGASLVPTFVFGEKYGFKVREFPKLIWKVLLKIFRVPIIMFWGRYFTWMPFQFDLGVVTGRPIDLPKIDIPDQTEEIVTKYHEMYMQELQRIFDTHKKSFGYADNEVLKFV